jgi:translocation and assembly module TamB
LIRDVTVRDKKQQNVATVPEIRVSVNPFKAFSGLEKAVSLIELEKPTVYIIQSKDESWNYEKLLKPSQSETTPFYGKINIKQGTAVVQLPEGTWQYQIDGSVDGSYNPAFDLNFKVSAPGMEPATVLGSIDNKGIGKIVMKSDGVDLAPYHPLALRYGQVKGAAGLVTDYPCYDTPRRLNSRRSICILLSLPTRLGASSCPTPPGPLIPPPDPSQPHSPNPAILDSSHSPTRPSRLA